MPGSYPVEYSIERLRTSGMVFVAGRAVSALLNICIFYLVATRLPIPTYALYVWLLALGRLLGQFSYVGLNSIALHYVPHIHSGFGGAVWRRFLITLVAARLALIVLSVGGLLALASTIVGFLGDPGWLEPLRWYALVLVIEHTLEFLRQCIFTPLLRQVLVQANLLAQASGVLAVLVLGLTMYEGTPTIYWVLGAHACGAGAALAIAATQFWHTVRTGTEPRDQGNPPTWREMIRFGLENFSHDLLNLSAGAQMMTLLGRRLLGVAELATFGFIQNLYLRLERFIPGRFFMALIRPGVVVRYRAEASFAELNRRVVLVLKLSFCAWAALATFLTVTGESIVAVLSSDKYLDGYGLLIGFIAILAIQDVKRGVILVANTLQSSTLLRRAGLIYLIAVPTALGLVIAGGGFYGLLLGMMVAELGFIVGAVHWLRRSGFELDFDLDGQARILAAAAVASAAGAGLVHLLPDGLGFTLLSGALTLPVYALALWRLRPLRAAERQALERLLDRKLSWL